MKKTLIFKIIPIAVLTALMCVYAAANDDVMMDGSGFFDPQEITGDVNLDGVVDKNDAVLVLRHSLFPGVYPVSYAGSLDFTGDGNVDAHDAILLLQYSLFPDIYPLE